MEQTINDAALVLYRGRLQKSCGDSPKGPVRFLYSADHNCFFMKPLEKQDEDADGWVNCDHSEDNFDIVNPWGAKNGDSDGWVDLGYKKSNFSHLSKKFEKEFRKIRAIGLEKFAKALISNPRAFASLRDALFGESRLEGVHKKDADEPEDIQTKFAEIHEMCAQAFRMVAIRSDRLDGMGMAAREIQGLAEEGKKDLDSYREAATAFGKNHRGIPDFGFFAISFSFSYIYAYLRGFREKFS